MTPGRQYAFGRFRLDADGRLLFRDEQRILLTPKAVDVLLTLVENRGASVTREELLLRVWPHAVVEDGTLSSHVALLRKTLGAEFIETIPKRGYRFIGTIEDSRILLAVLPFENLSGNKKYDSFSDGLTEEMITQLGRLNPVRLGVIARTSTMTYKSTDKTIEQIGRELGVSHILEGSARRAGARVRIAAQLIQVADQTHLWAHSYEGGLEDILSLQSSVSRAVAEQIQISLNVQPRTRQVVPAAYEAYLKGRYLWNRRTEHDLQTSIRFFQEAIDLDPGYASPYAGIADSYLSLMDHGSMPLAEATAKATPLLNKAVQLDDSLSEAHVSLGHTSFHNFDWAGAERELLRGIELNPNHCMAHFYYSNYLAAMRRPGEAINEATLATQLDPVSPSAQTNLASILWYCGQNERSIEQARRVFELNPEYSRGYEDLGRAYEQIGMMEPAIDNFLKALTIEDSQGVRASLAFTYTVAGKTAEAEEILEHLIQKAKTSFVSAYSFALIYVGLSRMDEAFQWFDRAYDERSSALPFLKVNPRLASLRSDPRFQRLLQRLAL